MIQIEESNPSFESCHKCIHSDDSEETCILRQCIHAVAQLKECYVPKQRTIEPQRKKGHWIQISPAGIYECSECSNNVMTGDISAYDFCHGCGADMREDAEEAKKCDTCKHVKSQWFNRCADCSDYELWEGKEE